MDWLHLLATVVWIGGMTTNLLVTLPALGEVLEPPMAGKLMGAIMKRFKPLIYTSMIILVISGLIMSIFNKSYPGLMQLGNLWSIIALIKHLLVALLIIIGIYAFEGLAPKIMKLAAKGPSPEIAALQKLQKKLALGGLGLGVLILLLTSIMSTISATS
jgi:uncharacterized membrane protein